MSLRAFIVTVGIALMILGAVLGLRSHTLDDAGLDGASVSCGSAFSPDNGPAQLADQGNDFSTALTTGRIATTTTVQDKCASATGSADIAWALIGVGLVAALGGAVVNRQSGKGGSSETTQWATGGNSME